MANNESEEERNDNDRLNSQFSGLLELNSKLNSIRMENEDSELSLKEIWLIFWTSKWLIIGVSFVFAVASVLYSLSLPNEYRATAILSPASQSGSNGLARLAGQFGGIASLAGINLGSGENDKSQLAVELLKTWGFQEAFIQKNEIEVDVFAAIGWDRSSNELKIDEQLYDLEKKAWVREVDVSKGQTLEPSGWELYKKLRDRIIIQHDKNSGLYSLSVDHYSPSIAKTWVELLVKAINQHIQEKDKQEALKSIEYLQKQIENTKVSEMKSVFYKLIEEQTKNLMLAEISDEYVFKTISPPKVPEEKVKPRRALIVLAITFLGGLIGCFVVLVRKI